MSSNTDITLHQLEVVTKPFLTAENTIVMPIATLSALFVVYGMYAIVFGLCMLVFSRRKDSKHSLYLICTISLFAFASLYVVMEVLGLIRQSLLLYRASSTRELEPLVNYLQNTSRETVATVFIANLVSTFMNAIADLMLVHRCYVLWGSNKFLLGAIMTVVLALNGIGLSRTVIISFRLSDQVHTKQSLHFAANNRSAECWIAVAVVNGLLSALTGGRIWWISREARRYMGVPIHARYKGIVAIM
ncbi:hypothetical protein PQX77_002736 [Marasmius sp. AFHP31]|nr:hypothetical protein PQX77_002736 [Marasmius sp. AFHP31]